MIRLHSFVVFSVLLGLTVSVHGQTPDTALIRKRFQVTQGNLWFHNIGLAFSGITHKDRMTDTVYYFNASPKPMAVWFEKLPGFITCDAFPDTLAPYGEGKMAVTYDAVVKGEYGRIVDYFFFYTDDPEKPQKRIIVSPNIEEDFSGLSDYEREHLPVIHIPEPEYNFGTIQEGDTAIHLYKVINNGERQLFIRATHASCGCTDARAINETLDPGETGEILVSFRSRYKIGEQYYTVSVVSNDPENPQVNLVIRGWVE